MLNLDKIVSKNNKNEDDEWPFPMLIIGPSGSGKTNTLLHLINNLHITNPIDKIYLYAKDLAEPKYEYLINKRERAGIKNIKDPRAFIEYSEDMNDVYDNISIYNKKRDNKVLIVFDDMIADIEYNKKFKKMIKELFYRSRKMNVSIVFITQSYFGAFKDARLNSTHYILMKIDNKKELKSIAEEKSGNLDYKDFLKMYNYCTQEPYSFMTIDARPTATMVLEKILKNFLIKMTRKDQIKILNNKIKSNNAQFKLDRLNAEICAFSEGNLDKYEFLTRKDLKYKPNALDKAKFEFSPLGKVFNQGLDKKAEDYEEEGVIKLLKDIRDRMFRPIGRNNEDDDGDGGDSGDGGNNGNNSGNNCGNNGADGGNNDDNGGNNDDTGENNRNNNRNIEYDAFDEDGFNRLGFDKDAFDREGFNRSGFHRLDFERDGFDRQSFDRDGFNRQDFNRQGFDRYGFNRQGFNRQGFDRDGFNRDGFNRDGFNRDGFNRDGENNGDDSDEDGDSSLEKEELAARFKRDIEKFKKRYSDDDGNNVDNNVDNNLDNDVDNGNNVNNVDNVNSVDYSVDNYSVDNFTGTIYDPYGFDKKGFNKKGLNEKGFDKDYIHKYTNTIYDLKDYDFFGFNRQGCNR